MADVTSDVCLALPAISAMREGYDVYAVMDASGTWNQLISHATMHRLSKEGVIVTGWVSIAAELQQDWRLETGEQLAAYYPSI